MSRMSSIDQRSDFEAQHKEKLQRTELTVWLKDFPRNAADLKEMHRQAARHTPDIDVAVHATFMIEENFKPVLDAKDE